MSDETSPMRSWQDVKDRTAILDDPQFTRSDVLKTTRLTPAQLKHTLDRDLVQLSTKHNPGTGRRRLFTGGDILKLIVAHTLSGIGVPMRMLWLFADMLKARASSRLMGDDIEHEALILYPCSNGDWQIVPLSAVEKPDSLPVAYSVLQVDLLIDLVIKQLEAAIADEPIPDFSVKPINEADKDFMREWDTDERGNKVLVGLTAEETAEYMQHAYARLTGTSDKWTVDEREKRGERYMELHGKHEAVRLERIGRFKESK